MKNSFERFLVFINFLLFFCGKPYEPKFIERYSKSELSSKPYDCNKLSNRASNHYILDNNLNPIIDASDSTKLLQYAIKHNQIKFAIENSDSNITKLLYLLPRIRGIINEPLYDSIIDNNFNPLNSLTTYNTYDLVISDAVISGIVFRKFQIQDSANCYYYKTEYLIRVIEVFHSYFPINIGDLILLKSTDGFVGGCNPNQFSSLVIKDHAKEFNVNDEWIFLLKHNDYYSKFISRIDKGKYSDIYCPSAFELYDGNQFFDYKNTAFMTSLRKFCKTF